MNKSLNEVSEGICQLLHSTNNLSEKTKQYRIKGKVKNCIAEGLDTVIADLLIINEFLGDVQSCNREDDIDQLVSSFNGNFIRNVE